MAETMNIRSLLFSRRFFLGLFAGVHFMYDLRCVWIEFVVNADVCSVEKMPRFKFSCVRVYVSCSDRKFSCDWISKLFDTFACSPNIFILWCILSKEYRLHLPYTRAHPLCSAFVERVKWKMYARRKWDTRLFIQWRIDDNFPFLFHLFLLFLLLLTAKTKNDHFTLFFLHSQFLFSLSAAFFVVFLYVSLDWNGRINLVD